MMLSSAILTLSLLLRCRPGVKAGTAANVQMLLVPISAAVAFPVTISGYVLIRTVSDEPRLFL